jgi:hypothetical protein
MAALSAGILVFAWPELSVRLRGVPASYAFVTAALAAILVAIVATWPPHAGEPRSQRPPARLLAAAVTAAAVGAIACAAYRWIQLATWQPYHADMLIVIREATRRFLSGRNPYTTYRSYDTSWEMAMPYGPGLWGPFLAAQSFRLDFRILSIAGELFVPVWCGVAAVVQALRGRLVEALGCLTVLGALLVALDVQGYTLIAHTPVYWPWVLLLAVMVVGGRYVAAAACLGILVVSRSTMAAMVPVFLMGVWRIRREQAFVVALTLVATIGAGLLPFLVWDHHALWDSMVLSYPRIMKAAVWPVLARPGLETIGITEWLLENHRDALIAPMQAAVMAGVYAAAWILVSRAHRLLPSMALALFAFSMTTLYPVHYLYYDVWLIVVSTAVVESIGSFPPGRALLAWVGSLAAIAAVVLAAVRLTAPPFLQVAVGEPPSDRMLREGFSGVEHDGSRRFSWIVGQSAQIVVPRSSAAAAAIVLTVESPFDDDQMPQRMTAVLNGTLLTETEIAAGRRRIRIEAPRSAWWVGFNQLRLQFASTVAPADVGAGADVRPLALAVERVEVVPER